MLNIFFGCPLTLPGGPLTHPHRWPAAKLPSWDRTMPPVVEHGMRVLSEGAWLMKDLSFQWKKVIVQAFLLALASWLSPTKQTGCCLWCFVGFSAFPWFSGTSPPRPLDGLVSTSRASVGRFELEKQSNQSSKAVGELFYERFGWWPFWASQNLRSPLLKSHPLRPTPS